MIPYSAILVYKQSFPLAHYGQSPWHCEPHHVIVRHSGDFPPHSQLTPQPSIQLRVRALKPQPSKLVHKVSNAGEEEDQALGAGREEKASCEPWWYQAVPARQVFDIAPGAPRQCALQTGQFGLRRWRHPVSMSLRPSNALLVGFNHIERLPRSK